VEREPPDDAGGDARPAATLGSQLVDLVPVDGDERELGGDEERSGEDQRRDGAESERGVQSGSSLSECAQG
jgi:hypothetical protein